MRDKEDEEVEWSFDSFKKQRETLSESKRPERRRADRPVNTFILPHN